MQFTKVRLVGLYTIDMPLFGLRSSNRYICKGIDGLGPPEIDNFLVNGVYNGRQPQDRQIVMRVGLNPAYSVGETPASLRTAIYGLLTPGPDDSITFKLMNGPNVVVVTKGYVSKIEPVIFAKDPEVQITIDCEGSYLEAETETSVVPSTKSPFTVTNPGSVTTGFYYEMTLNVNGSKWVLYTQGPGAGAKMELDYAFLSGDKIMVDTRDGQRSIKVLRGGVTTNLIYTLSSDSIWVQLHPGDNTFWPSTNVFTWGKVNFTPQYWGV
jgi:hypothetical protein